MSEQDFNLNEEKIILLVRIVINQNFYNYSRHGVRHVPLSSKGVTVDLSRIVVKNQRQEGDNPPMKKAFGFLLRRNQRHFWYFWCQKYIHYTNIIMWVVRYAGPYTLNQHTAHSGIKFRSRYGKRQRC